ncbi:MAG: hypothetical protein KZQ83_10930 [gamma proteobacterium symbiont of Taylorina sp.]|nr:hypothetical protein [gamma proteobacterium symbiont of Taylorina sp.]
MEKSEKSLFLPEFIPTFSQEQKQWRPLHLLNLYRLLISGIFSSLIFADIQLNPFGMMEPELFQIISFAYLTASFLNGITIRWHWPNLWLQTHLHIIIDITAIILIMHTSGGVKSGVGLLLLIPIASISILSMARSSLFYAALASLLLLLDQTYLQFSHAISTNYTQSGLLGAILFLTAILTNYLVHKTEESIEIANQREIDLANMEQLSQFIMQKMQTAVIVVDHLGYIKLLNDTALHLFHLSSIKDKQNNLADYSTPLAELFHTWNEDPNFQAGTFRLDNSSTELLPRFALLGDTTHSDAVIFIEDNAELAQQAQQLKLASLGSLTASIAHELRNPLAAIRHAGELLNESPALEKTDKRLTEIIEKQSIRVNDIITTVLDLSRRNQAELEKINLSVWITDFFKEYIHLPQERFQLKFEPENLEVCFDPQHLYQIFNNLIQNALRHTIEHNEKFQAIIITVGKRIRTRDATSIPYLQVMNYGDPIAKEHLSRLFEPFFTTETSGTGLGLYIAQELAKCNSARLEYIEHKDGACFQLNFAHFEKN